VRTGHFGFIARSFAGALLVHAFMQLLPPPAEGGVEIVQKDDFSLELGLRLQPRMEIERVGAPGDTMDWRDFLVRRTRIKIDGKMHAARYKFEWKIDRTDQLGAKPSASVENAYVQYPLGRGVELRAGLYDLPYSRDRLTSDSKQLAVDRGTVSNVPDAHGLADNAVGFHFLGKVAGDRAEYAVGLFDNRTKSAELQDIPMVAGRLDLNFGSTKSVFNDAHFGNDSWYSLGLNGSYQGAIEDSTGGDDGSNAALGIDGMIDVPTGPGRLFARGEINALETKKPQGGTAVDTTVWMLGLGYLVLDQRLQPIVRFDRGGGGTRDMTYVGVNFYQKGHDLKVQADIRLEAGTGNSVDGGRLQAQVDF